MPEFETIRRVPHSPAHMYSVVADVAKYPEFLPLIEDLTILSRAEADGIATLEADMTIGYKAINETFRSKVLLNPAENSITTTSHAGPFSHMENRWKFLPVETATSDGGLITPASAQACDVHFFIDYKFKSWMLEKMMGQMFEKAFRTYAESFEARASALPPADLTTT